MRPVIAGLLLCASLFSAGCLFKRKPPPPPPPVPAQRPPLEIPAPKTEPPKPLEAPKVDIPAPEPLPEPTVIRPRLEKVEPPKPAAQKPRARRTQPARAAKPKETPAAPPAPAANTESATAPSASETTPAPPPPLPPPAAPAPKLGEVLPDEQRREYLASIDADLAAAQKVLRDVEGKPLSRDQSENANRIRTFVQQAGEARSSNITAAVQLARRAAVLAAELARSIDR